MASKDDGSNAAREVFDATEVDQVLSGSFYQPQQVPPSSRRTRVVDKPDHYKVICISMYVDALERLDAMVKELKARGYTKANRSALIRHALTSVDLDDVPRGL